MKICKISHDITKAIQNSKLLHNFCLGWRKIERTVKYTRIRRSYLKSKIILQRFNVNNTNRMHVP